MMIYYMTIDYMCDNCDLFDSCDTYMKSYEYDDDQFADVVLFSKLLLCNPHVKKKTHVF